MDNRRCRKNIRPELQKRLPELTENLAEKQFLLEDKTPDGRTGYMRSYLFAIVLHYTFEPDDSKICLACLHWWKHVVDDGESAQFRAQIPEMRVLPHEGALTGEEKFGHIPMNLEIPDKREVLAMDSVEAILQNCHSIAVEGCQCRVTKDLLEERTCNYPSQNVCFMLNRLADDEVAAGMAKPVTLEEALKMIRQFRNMGLVQTVSNAENPLCICNCCSCCCVCMRSLQRYETTVSRTSRYIAQIIRSEKCVGCGVCVKVCPMDAVKLESGKLQLMEKKCIGCGLCVSRCSRSVLKLNKRTDASDQYERKDMDRVYL